MTPLAVVACAVVALALLVVCYRLVTRGQGGHVALKAGPLSFDFQTTLQQIAEGVAEVNASVNGVEPGEPKLRATVERMARKVDHMADVQVWQTGSIQVVAGAVGVELTPPPATPEED